MTSTVPSLRPASPEPAIEGDRRRREAAAALAPSTQRAYARDWHAFRQWCRTQGHEALPADPALVAAYLASLMPALGKSGLEARLAAIAHYHRRHGQDWVPGHPVIRAALRDGLRQHGTAVRPAATLTTAEIERLLACCGDDLAGLRDRALLLTGFAGGLRRSELVAIDRAHLRMTEAGLVLHIPRRTRSQGGADIILPWRRGEAACPVRAMEAWLRRSGIGYGAVFRGVSVHGTLERRLSPDGVRKILLRLADRAGLTVDPGTRLSPEALRASRRQDDAIAESPARRTP